MHPAIKVVQDHKRGCGWRKAGGLYLMCGAENARGCGKLPIPLSLLNKCPHCQHDLPKDYGIRLSRAPRMIADPQLMFAMHPCVPPQGVQPDCGSCPISNHAEMSAAMLMTIGEKFYPMPSDFNEEVKKYGISRRISQIPEGFVVGESWVMIAHSKAIHCGKQVLTHDPKTGQQFLIPEERDVWAAGIFKMFKPDRIEMPITGNETDEEIERLVKRGITPVMIERLNDDGDASHDDDAEAQVEDDSNQLED